MNGDRVTDTILLISAALLVVVVAIVWLGSSVSAAVPFPVYRSEVQRLGADIGIQVSVLHATDDRHKELLRLRDVVDESLDRLHAMGWDECYRIYAQTVTLSLELYRAAIQSELDGAGILGAFPQNRASSFLLQGAAAVEGAITADCEAIAAPIPASVINMPVA